MISSFRWEWERRSTSTHTHTSQQRHVRIGYGTYKGTLPPHSLDNTGFHGMKLNTYGSSLRCIQHRTVRSMGAVRSGQNQRGEHRKKRCSTVRATPNFSCTRHTSSSDTNLCDTALVQESKGTLPHLGGTYYRMKAQPKSSQERRLQKSPTKAYYCTPMTHDTISRILK